MPLKVVVKFIEKLLFPTPPFPLTTAIDLPKFVLTFEAFSFLVLQLDLS